MIVCLCKGVSERKLKQLIAEGARTIREVQKSCGAGQGCGSCVERLCELTSETPAELGDCWP